MSVRSRVYRERRLPAERPAAAIVAGLWRNGEQGAWYDPSDLSTMFQDASGTTPVYMPGQGLPDCWIGLQLDKRFGLARGPERLTNGDFSAGNASWITLNTDATHVTTFSGGTLRFQADTLSPALQVQQMGAMTVGRWYEITVVVSAYTGGSLKTDALQAAGSGFVIANGLGAYRTIGISTSAVFSFTRGAVNTDITIDSISIRELPGNHRWQGTATSRAVLSARYNLLTKSEDLSDAAVWANQVSGTGSAPVRTKDYAAAPNGSMTATRLQLALNGGGAASDRSGVAQTVSSTTTGAGYGCAIWLKAASAGSVGRIVLLRHMAGTTYLPCVLTAEWKVFGRVEAAATNYGVVTLELRGASGGASDSVDMLVWGADLRVANDGVGLPPYQRVADANTYDTVGFPLYRKPDGVDDWMQTASVDFTGTGDIFVSVAARKISDATLQANLVELSNSSTANNGTFWLAAPWAVSSGAGFRSRGTSIASAFSNVTPTANETAVLTGVGSVSRGVCQLWKNGVLIASDTASQGAGSLGNYPIFFDRRGGTTLPSGARDYGTIIVGRLLTGPETAAVEKLLRSKSRAY